MDFEQCLWLNVGVGFACKVSSNSGSIEAISISFHGVLYYHRELS